MERGHCPRCAGASRLNESFLGHEHERRFVAVGQAGAFHLFASGQLPAQALPHGFQLRFTQVLAESRAGDLGQGFRLHRCGSRLVLGACRSAVAAVPANMFLTPRWYDTPIFNSRNYTIIGFFLILNGLTLVAAYFMMRALLAVRRVSEA